MIHTKTHHKTLNTIYACDIPVRLVRMKQEAVDMGLFKTAAALDLAMERVGWELAARRERLEGVSS